MIHHGYVYIISEQNQHIMKKKLPIKNKNNSGFTIVELAIVLTVVSLIAGGSLAVGASRLEASRINTTQDRMNFLMEALGVYVKQYCHLPCPTDPLASNASANFGLGLGSGGAPIGCTSPNIERHAATNVLAGAVPVRSMRISPVLMLDGWGRKFMYIVDEQLTYKVDVATNSGYTISNGQIMVKAMNTQADANAVTNEAGVLVMSYGTDGHGAWRGKGTTRLEKGTADADQLVNAHTGNGTTTGSAFDHIFVQKFNTATFDDLIEYKIKWQLPDSTNCST
jgi:prepilin-type N-terminal cleavage/methylation domain-containing protein